MDAPGFGIGKLLPDFFPLAAETENQWITSYCVCARVCVCVQAADMTGAE